MKSLRLRWHLWNAVLAVAIGSAAVVACDPVQAQTVCRHWTDGFGLDMEGTPAQGCAGAAARFATVFPDRAPVTVTNCVYSTDLVVTVTLSNPVDSGTLTVTDSGACTAEPPDPGASDPTGEPVDWTNETHLLQLLLTCCCVFIFTHGYGAGNRL